MALNFPSSPSNGQTYIANGVTYVYNGTKTLWESTGGSGVTAIDADTLDGLNSTAFLRADINDAAAGEITFQSLIYLSATDSIAAAGTTQGTGTALTTTINRVTTITAASAEAVVLPTAQIGKIIYVYNDDTADTLKIFPGVSDTIDGNAANASIDLGPGAVMKFYAISASLWIPDYGTYA